MSESGVLGVQSWGPFAKRNLANLASFGGNLANFGEFWRKFGEIWWNSARFGEFWRTCTLASEFGLLWLILAWAFGSFQPKFAKCAHCSVSHKGSNFECQKVGLPEIRAHSFVACKRACQRPCKVTCKVPCKVTSEIFLRRKPLHPRMLGLSLQTAAWKFKDALRSVVFLFVFVVVLNCAWVGLFKFLWLLLGNTCLIVFWELLFSSRRQIVQLIALCFCLDRRKRVMR